MLVNIMITFTVAAKTQTLSALLLFIPVYVSITVSSSQVAVEQTEVNSCTCVGSCSVLVVFFISAAFVINNSVVGHPAITPVKLWW